MDYLVKVHISSNQKSLQGCYKGVQRLLQVHYKGVSRVFQMCLKKERYKLFKRALQERYNGIEWILQGRVTCYMFTTVSQVFP